MDMGSGCPLIGNTMGISDSAAVFFILIPTACSGILAVLAAGTTFSMTSTVGEKQDEDRVVEGVDLFFIIPIFILLGLVAPWRNG